MATRCSPLFVWLSRATFKHKTCRLSTLSLISFRFQVSNILKGEQGMENSVAGYGISYTDARCADGRHPLILAHPLDSCSCNVILRDILPLRDILLCASPCLTGTGGVTAQAPSTSPCMVKSHCSVAPVSRESHFCLIKVHLQPTFAAVGVFLTAVAFLAD